MISKSIFRVAIRPSLFRAAALLIAWFKSIRVTKLARDAIRIKGSVLRKGESTTGSPLAYQHMTVLKRKEAWNLRIRRNLKKMSSDTRWILRRIMFRRTGVWIKFDHHYLQVKNTIRKIKHEVTRLNLWETQRTFPNNSKKTTYNTERTGGAISVGLTCIRKCRISPRMFSQSTKS